ncbi:MAG: NUDIX domain-containing protein [Salana multivorans]|nr:NUDIX domain-containing protein [Salana multivorans]
MRSAALAVVRLREAGPEVLLGHMGGPLWTRRERSWSIPKGLYGDDEDPASAARRELAEETGYVWPQDRELTDLGADQLLVRRPHGGAGQHVEVDLLGEQPDAQRPRVLHRPGRRGQPAGEHAEERRLAGAVRSRDEPPLTRAHRERGGRQPAGDRDVARHEHGSAPPGPATRAPGVRRRVQPREPLPRRGLAHLRRLELGEPRPGVVDATGHDGGVPVRVELLRRVGLRPRGPADVPDRLLLAHAAAQTAQLGLLVAVAPLPPLARVEPRVQVGRVPAGEPDQTDPRAVAVPDQRSRHRVRDLARVEVDETGHGLVEERPVVRGEQNRTAPRGQHGTQVGDGVVVEMVRRLVEEQDVGLGQQQPGQRQPRELATRERRDGPVGGDVRQPEPGEHRGLARGEAPDVERLRALQGAGVPGGRRVVVGGGGQCARRVVELGLGVAHDGGRAGQRLGERDVGGERRLLVEEPDAGGRARAGHGGGSGVRRQEAGRDAQERRLARAVLADEAEALAGRDHQVDVGEHAALAVGDGHAVEPELDAGRAGRGGEVGCWLGHGNPRVARGRAGAEPRGEPGRGSQISTPRP